MIGIAVLLAQAAVYFVSMALIFANRRTVGLGLFFCVLGTMHFLETYLAAVFFIELPFGLISPGSTVLFTGKLAFLLLLYIKEDADIMRQPIYGLLIGNMLILGLALILRLYSNPADLPGYNPDLRFVDQIGLLMVWGTVLLFVDIIAMVLIYERLGRSVVDTIPGRIFVSLAIVLTFDQMFFYLGLQFLSGVPESAFYGGWIAKIAAAAFFTLMLTLYLRFIETSPLPARSQGPSDVFDRLTYRHRYERLAEQVGKDALTGLQDRGRFDSAGPRMLENSSQTERSLSLLMIDIDHFKSINDRYGHLEGDRVIQKVAATISGITRAGDEFFRYGGEEFALLCSDTPPGAVALAERIRTAVAGSVAHPDPARAVTVSIGVATFPRDAKEFQDLMRRADAALYEAKSLGRNRVVEFRSKMQQGKEPM